MSVLHKTKLCKFNVIGECNRGHKCGFAHSAAELQPVPDLSRTKMCPVLSKAGTCDDSNCRYAHETVQRRKKAFVYFGKGVVSKPRYCVPDAQHDASAYSTNNDVAHVGAELCQDDAEQTISSDDAGMHFGMMTSLPAASHGLLKPLQGLLHKTQSTCQAIRLCWTKIVCKARMI